MKRIFAVAVLMCSMIPLPMVFAAALNPATSSWVMNPQTGKTDYVANLPEICDGPTGVQGPQGFRGYSGAKGDPGVGVPMGGTTGQRLVKKSNADYDTEWQSPGAIMINWGDISGTLSNQTDLQSALNAKEPANSNIQAHIGATNNPHATTIDQVAPPQAGNAGKALVTNGSTISYGTVSATPGGSNKQVQYNNNGAFAGFGRYSSGCLIL